MMAVLFSSQSQHCYQSFKKVKIMLSILKSMHFHSYTTLLAIVFIKGFLSHKVGCTETMICGRVKPCTVGAVSLILLLFYDNK